MAVARELAEEIDALLGDLEPDDVVNADYELRLARSLARSLADQIGSVNRASCRPSGILPVDRASGE